MRDLSRASRTYELLTILTPDVPEEAIPETLDQISSYISNAGGTVTETLRESPWGRRRLAYAIRHAGRDVRDGFYTLFHFDLDPGKVVDIERDLRLNDQVIRHLVTHYTPRPVEELEAIDGAAGDVADDAAASAATPVGAAVDGPVAATLESPVAEAESAVEPAAELVVDDAALPEEPQTAETTADDDGAATEIEEPGKETDEPDEQ